MEAKAHTAEIKSECGAKPEGGLERIKLAFDETIKANGFAIDADKWLTPYYQFANRLASLHCLLQHGIQARLILIYFMGGQWSEVPAKAHSVSCPKSEDEWNPFLSEMYAKLGLAGTSRLEQRVHRIFLDVNEGLTTSH